MCGRGGRQHFFNSFFSKVLVSNCTEQKESHRKMLLRTDDKRLWTVLTSTGGKGDWEGSYSISSKIL